MQLNHDYFLELVKEKNYRRAAQNLYISQPALSKYIQRLEEQLGITLFDRTSTPLKLTYAGELYLEYVKKRNTLDRSFTQTVNELNDLSRGRITVGLTPYRGSWMLPAVLPIFNRRYPKTEVVLREGASYELIDMLLNDEIDFCISNPIDAFDYSQLEYDVLLKENIYLAVSTQYPRLTTLGIDPEDIFSKNTAHIYPLIDLTQMLSEQFYLTTTNQTLTKIIETNLGERNLRLEKVFRSSNLCTCLNLTSAGLGFTFMPEFSIGQDYSPHNLLFLNTQIPPISWNHAVFFRKGAFISTHCKYFISTLKEIFKSGPYVQNK